MAFEKNRDTTWIEEAIERAATPQVLRKESTEVWCDKRGVSPQAYYYQLSKEENQKKILDISLNVAKRALPDVLECLIKSAKSGREKSIEMYLDYIIKLAKNLDIKSDGKPLIQVASEIATKYGLTSQNSSDSSKG